MANSIHFGSQTTTRMTSDRVMCDLTGDDDPPECSSGGGGTSAAAAAAAAAAARGSSSGTRAPNSMGAP